MPLTKERMEEYIKSGGGWCPYCGSDDITASDYNETGCRVDCDNLDCGAYWWEVHTLLTIIEGGEA